MENRTQPNDTFRHLCVIAKHELNARPHETYADVVEAVKRAAARARIFYNGERVGAAIEQVVASTKYRFHDPTTEHQVPAKTAPPSPIPRLPQPASQAPPQDGLTSISLILQELVRRQALTPERTRA